jgi:hypothetical protein
VPRCPDPLQKHTRGLVIRALRYQLATERLGEDGLVEVVDQLAGTGGFRGEAVDPAEGNANSICDLLLRRTIKLHKAQLASDRMSCHSATANQVRLALHTVAFWLHCVRSAIPETNPLARCEFATLGGRLIKIGARVIEHIARIRVQLPTSCPEGALFRAVALGLMPSGP